MKYKTEIKGYGEIYEEVSIEFLRQRLRRKYKTGTLYLVPESDEKGREDLIIGLFKALASVHEMGSVDCPPWKSKPKREGKIPPLLLRWLARIVFLLFFVPYEARNKPHMLWILTAEERTSS